MRKQFRQGNEADVCRLSFLSVHNEKRCHDQCIRRAEKQSCRRHRDNYPCRQYTFIIDAAAWTWAGGCTVTPSDSYSNILYLVHMLSFSPPEPLRRKRKETALPRFVSSCSLKSFSLSPSRHVVSDSRTPAPPCCDTSSGWRSSCRRSRAPRCRAAGWVRSRAWAQSLGLWSAPTVKTSAQWTWIKNKTSLWQILLMH